MITYGEYQFHTINMDCFQDLDTEAVSYWLGFIYADGCIVQYSPGSLQFRLKLSAKDKDHLETFRGFIGDAHPLLRRDRMVGFTVNPSYLCQFNNYTLCIRLVKLGVTPRKTFDLQPPPNGVLINHFIRGYSDGDGSFSWQRRTADHLKPQLHWSLTCASRDFLDWVVTVLDHELGIHLQIVHKSNSRAFGLQAVTVKAEQLRDWLYRDSTIYLERKKEKAYGNGC